MTAPLLRVPCELHGKWEAHRYGYTALGTVMTGALCPGGREPTVEETTQWLKAHKKETLEWFAAIRREFNHGR